MRMDDDPFMVGDIYAQIWNGADIIKLIQ